MIYTVTLNPALDYVMQVKKLGFEDINRSYYEDLHFGGKGINVSVMLKRMGVDTKALGFIAGFTGKRLEELVKNEGVDCGFLTLGGGETRINVKIKSDRELDINARGPHIDNKDIEKLMCALDNIKEGDYLVISGSVPENLPGDIYATMLSRLLGRGINFIIDTNGELLLSVLKYKPFLIKPNHHELGDLFSVKIETVQDAVTYAKKMQEMGAKNVLVSRGGKGAVLIDENGGVFSVGIVEGKVVNTAGCGDSMVAGFLAGYEKTGDYSYALRLGAAAGSATAFCEALSEVEDIKSAFNKLKIN